MRCSESRRKKWAAFWGPVYFVAGNLDCSSAPSVGQLLVSNFHVPADVGYTPIPYFNRLMEREPL